MNNEPQPVLEARKITKIYPGTVALDDASIRIDRGRVRALIGENGAGKSTLVKILAGVEQPSAGTLRLDGTETVFASVRDATARGIGIIHQELNLCPNLSVSDNIFLGYELASRGLLKERAQERRTRELLQLLDHPIDPNALVGELPLGQQQIVEIARALAHEVKVLMMDEPTSALSASEIGVLFRLIGDLKSRGVAIVYISHRLEELLKISDDITVLRDGRIAGEALSSDIDSRWIVDRMTGRSLPAAGTRSPSKSDRELLRAENLILYNETARPILNRVSFSLRAGEVLGIYGLMGAGRTELLESLMALRPGLSGGVWLNATRIDRLTASQRIESGIAMVPEDRQTGGLIPTLSVGANMTLASLPAQRSGVFLSREKEAAASDAMISRLRIKTPGIGASIQALSGGNQQKVVLAKCLLTSPQVLLLDEPTRGVDVSAKADIYSAVRQLASEGMGIIYVCSELEEVRSVSDRILVMSRGAVTGEFNAVSVSGEELTAAAS
ncbi:MAG TPA: sugar ABC transporter ATP-binding protein [Bryobacteraceae bacterium]|nr:sugar ABC transporter ATP-binding protein [Bryobacteraceae bacterium]